MSVPSDRLIKWITKCLSGLVKDDDAGIVVSERGTISRFELSHTSEGEANSPLAKVNVEPGVHPEDIAQELHDNAEYDASTRMSSRPQRYIARAFIADEPYPDSMHAFVVVSRSALELRGDDPDTEPPNAKGLTSQLMRHTEQMQEMTLKFVEVCTGRLIRDLETEREARVKLENDFARIREVEQSLLDRHQERELEGAKAIQQAKRADELMQMGMTMLPALISGMTKQSVPIKNQAEIESLKQFFKSLDQSEIEGVLNSLQPEHQKVLLNVYSAFARQHIAEQQQKPDVFRDK